MDNHDTCFAPSERSGEEEIMRQYASILLDDVLNDVIQAMPESVLLLNGTRQIVALNQRFLAIAGADNVEDILGKRPGEALDCIFAEHAPGGCGTDEHCSVCGAVLAILESQVTNTQVARECRVTVNRTTRTSIDVEVTATPIDVRGERYTVVALRDIGTVKRREVLENLFLHDLLNTAGGIYGIASILQENDHLPDRVEMEYKGWLVNLSGNLLDEIRTQRKMLAAEKGEFVPELTTVGIKTILDDVNRIFSNHESSSDRHIEIIEFPDILVMTDASLLRRVIGNMTINALEASPIGATIRISVETADDRVIFHVWNQGVIPHEVQLQLFMRSFSTKGAVGRGLGTYCMKLFGERYLKGNVSFTSTVEQGTTFTLSIPISQ